MAKIFFSEKVGPFILFIGKLILTVSVPSLCYIELQVGRISMRNVHPKGSMSFALKLGLIYCLWAMLNNHYFGYIYHYESQKF